MTDDPDRPQPNEPAPDAEPRRPMSSEDMIREAREDVYDDDPFEGVVDPARDFETDEGAPVADAEAASGYPPPATVDPVGGEAGWPVAEADPPIDPEPVVASSPFDTEPSPLVIEGSRRSGWSILLRILLAATAVLAGWWLIRTFVTDDGTEVQSLEPGDCFLGFEGTSVSTVEVVDCSEPHVYEVFHNVVLPDGPYPGETSVDQSGTEGCLAEFDGFVGLPYEQSVWLLTTLIPVEEAWPDDRTVNCLLFRADDADPTVPATVTGSAQGSAI